MKQEQKNISYRHLPAFAWVMVIVIWELGGIMLHDVWDGLVARWHNSQDFRLGCWWLMAMSSVLMMPLLFFFWEGYGLAAGFAVCLLLGITHYPYFVKEDS
jgi:hypothetical protein